MEKLPEKWCVYVSTNEECKILADWVNKNKAGIVDGYVFTPGQSFTIGYGYGEDNNSTRITFEQFKKLVLGEPEKFIIKAGDHVEVIDSPSLRNWFRWKEAVGYRFFVENSPSAIDIINEGGESSGIDEENKYGINYSLSSLKLVSIPQQEETDNKPLNKCDFIMCVGFITGFTQGKIYPLNNTELRDDNNEKRDGVASSSFAGFSDRFKPSTREAYEAQENNNNLNKVSQLKTNKNEHSKEDNTRETGNQEGKIIEVQGSDFRITSHPPIRGKGINHPNVKISVGNGSICLKGRIIEG